MKRVTWLCLLGVALFFLLSSPAGQYAHAQPAIDHYNFYETSGPGVFDALTLKDQFGTSVTTVVLYLLKFGTPVSKNGSPIHDLSAHLSWYGLSETQPERQIGVLDQFGAGEWTIGGTVALLAPALKDQSPPIPVKNHYKCYGVTQGPTINQTVTLIDQFGLTEVFVTQAKYFCNPVEKIHGGEVYPIIDSLAHLAIYEALDPGTINEMVSYHDQFYSGYPIPVVGKLYLAVPAWKEYPVAIEESTWGQIKAMYRSEDK
jgi:hypothetical protein